MSTTKLTPKLMGEYLLRKTTSIPKANQISKDYYPYIQANREQLTKIILEAINTFTKNNPKQGTIKILDVGCGTGGAMLMIEAICQVYNAIHNTRYWFDVHGIEIDPVLIEIAKKQKCRITCNYSKDPYKSITQDALEFDRYKEYDIIYFYHPIENKKLEYQLEEKIQKEMHPGAVIAAPMKAVDITTQKYGLFIPDEKEFDVILQNCIGNVVLFKKHLPKKKATKTK